MPWGFDDSFPLAGKMAAPVEAVQPLVQYLVLRGDLARAPFSWPLGALVAQGCHAAVAALHAHRDHPKTTAYLQDLGSMRKVVLEAPDEVALMTLAETLKQNNVDYILWLEQPENIATCIALRPYFKGEVNTYLRKFKLLK